MIALRTAEEIQKMRECGKILYGAMKLIGKEIKVGMTTGEIDKLATDYIEDHGAVPAFRGFQGFPGNICASIGSEVVHGIPGDRVLADGDIVGIDIGVKKNGYYSDSARTFAVGDISKEVRQLLNVTDESLYLGIEKAVAGNKLSEISKAIQTHAERYGYGVVRQLVGHGIGTALHEEPKVPNFVDRNPGPTLRVGMVLAIEPMINLGSPDIATSEDGWTITTRDGYPSAHFEHTIAITEAGPKILTNGSDL